ncbi:MAG: TetR/AcrR family transcriptional regulator [Ilumatobacteraceae bacterium]
MTEAKMSLTARERVRVELIGEIKTVARRHLAEHGSSALSLRAVARDVGMVSSAVYRYFPSRDDLLTAMIVDAYVAFGEAVMIGDATVRRSHYLDRWMAATAAARAWARTNPQEYALIFGSPIPGYQAPTDTVDPAAIAPMILLAIAADASAAGRTLSVPTDRPVPRSVRSDLRRLAGVTARDLDVAVMGRCLMAWTQVIGSISFELFGHLHNVIDDYDAYFAFQMRGIALDLGWGG